MRWAKEQGKIHIPNLRERAATRLGLSKLALGVQHAFDDRAHIGGCTRNNELEPLRGDEGDVFTGHG